MFQRSEALSEDAAMLRLLLDEQIAPVVADGVKRILPKVPSKAFTSGSKAHSWASRTLPF